MKHNLFCKFLADYRKDGKCYCNIEMRPVGWEVIDPVIIQQGADLYDYERAGLYVSDTFSEFSRRDIAKLWQFCGWKRFFTIAWWKFKFRLAG